MSRSEASNHNSVTSQASDGAYVAPRGHSVAASGNLRAATDGPIPPMRRLVTICGLCGKHATGLASINDTRYCHGDNDLEPTCYQRVTRDRLLTDVAWDAISGIGQNLLERR